MNIAYSRYLQNALEHSTLTDEEKQGAHAFLKFLSNYKPKGLSLREPDFYGYGDAFGQYGVTYFDKGSLEDNGIDPGKLDALQFDQLMTRWTEEPTTCSEAMAATSSRLSRQRNPGTWNRP